MFLPDSNIVLCWCTTREECLLRGQKQSILIVFLAYRNTCRSKIPSVRTRAVSKLGIPSQYTRTPLPLRFRDLSIYYLHGTRFNGRRYLIALLNILSPYNHVLHHTLYIFARPLVNQVDSKAHSLNFLLLRLSQQCEYESRCSKCSFMLSERITISSTNTLIKCWYSHKILFINR